MLSIFKKKTNTGISNKNLGILVFENTSEVIQAEKLLKINSVKIRVMGPPPKIQTGCDLVIEFELIKELNIMRILKDADISPQQIVPVTDPLLVPVDLFQSKRFENFLMVRAANMKITVDLNTQIIVNISGGGCPDVPYLAYKMVGETITNAPDPLEIGHTLCGYALGLAFKEIKKQC
jgi:putative Se/S carrier protein